MDVSTFFTRLLQPTKVAEIVKPADDIEDFDKAWTDVLETLAYPDERQLVRGIESTSVPADLRHIVDALVYESSRTDEDTTGQCLEYFLRNDLLTHLERLCEDDKPHGIRSEVLKSINNLVALLSERFLMHNAIHRPLRRLLRSCVGDDPEEKLSGSGRKVGAAAMDDGRDTSQFEGDLVDLMCILCSKMRAYPPLLLIFFHDKGWLKPHPSSGAPDPTHQGPSLHPSSPVPSTSSPAQPKNANQRFEFLLFSYLLRFVHREGKTGDFARAGLLFLFDIAFLSPSDEGGENLSMPLRDGTDPLQDARDALGEYILDGDFAEVMTAGLGAIYSLLPSKLRVPTLAESARAEEGITASTSGGMHLGAGVPDPSAVEDEDAPLLASTADADVRTQLDLLLKLFGFLQDIVTRCNSALHAEEGKGTGEVSSSHLLGPAIAESILDALQRAFLETVLYPAILECSAKDGSSVAVLTYLDVIFSHLDDGPLLQCTLDYLMDTTPTAAHASRRSSGFGVLDTMAGVKEPAHDESKFTLKDLILDNLRSDSSDSSTAALRLLDTLLREHCSSASQGILRAIPMPSGRPVAPIHRYDSNEALPGTPPDLLPPSTNSIDEHHQETEMYGSLIARIDPAQTSAEVSPGYGGYLADIEAALSSDGCYLSRLAPHHEDDPGPSNHRLHPSDTVVRAVLDSLSHFLTSSSDANVALTGVIISLAMCPHRSLSGWLLYDMPESGASNPWQRAMWRHVTSGSDSDDSEDDDPPASPLDRKVTRDPFIAAAAATIDPPAVYQILKEVANQIHRFRLDVDDFDRLLAERRQGLLFADHLDEAMNVMLDVETASLGTFVPGSPERATFASPPRPARTTSAFGSLKSFLTPKRKPPEPASTVLFSASPTPGGTIRDQAAKIGQSPFKTHYEHVSSFTLEATPSPGGGIASGPWSPSPAKSPLAPTPKRKALALHESVFGTPRTPGTPAEQEVEEEPRSKQVSLSQVLDNCVILEEFLKEIVSVITARRALGVDQVGFV